MSKKLMVASALGCGACAYLVTRNRPGQGKGRPNMWEKMQGFMDDMPEDFPPRIMFDNLAATRENTERILEILEQRDDSVDSREPEAGEA